jgi:hypothetical protein
MTRWTVEVTGLRQVIDALNESDKKAARVIVKKITDAGKRVAASASYNVPGTNPVSGWGVWTSARDGRDLGFDPATVSRSFKVRRNNFRRRGVSAGAGWDVYNTSPGGSIWEVMGSGQRVTTSSGLAMVDAVNDRFPAKQPRSLFAAYYQNMTPEFRDEVADLILTEMRKAGLT